MQQWDYCRIFATWSSKKNDLVTCIDGTSAAVCAQTLEPTLTETAVELGRGGWELVGLVAPGDMGSAVVAMFKRPVV